MAGGLGTRMRSETPKHLHPLLGRRLVDWVIEATRALRPDPLVVVTSPGTEDAFDVVSGDAAAIRPESLSALLETHRTENVAATVLAFERAKPGDYGRIVRGADG